MTIDHKKVMAPFNDDQLSSLNNYQLSNKSHPFTCLNRHILRATTEGWVCDICSTEIQGNWAHIWMTNWEWKEEIKKKKADS